MDTKNIQKKGLLQVHLAVLLFGMSSLFAKMVYYFLRYFYG